MHLELQIPASTETNMSSREEKIKEFCTITGATEQVAQQLLSVCNDSLEMAINMHMEGVDVGSESPVTSHPNNKNSHDGPQSTSSSAGPSNTSSKREETDDTEDVEEVRAPIPQKQETLIDAGYEGYPMNNRQNYRKARIRTVFDGFRNFGNEATGHSSQQESLMSQGKKRTLEELFKPPLDIMFKGDWQSARDAATAANKWLLVNIQDAGEFQCQTLNRDVWSNDAVKTIIREHFLFWQQYKESDEAQRYLTFYPIEEWPHVTVIDPRTGEKLITWNKLDSACFCDLVSSFLESHPNFSQNHHNGSSPQPKKKRPDDNIVDADEDDQLAAAIQASLAESQKPSSSNSYCDAIKNRITDAYTETPSDSDLEIYSGDDSNLSTPVKKIPSNSQNTEALGCQAGSHIDLSKKEEKTWEAYLGNEADLKSTIMVRFPDGRRETKIIPCTSQFMAIIKFVVSEGYPLERYEIVTNFPRRKLTDMDETKTLKELQLFPQETVFVQQRS